MHLRALATAALALTYALVSITPAGAYTLTGCKYDDGSIDPIQYRFYSVTSSYVTAFQDAQADWDRSSSPGYFGESTTSLDPELPVHDGTYAGDFWAQVEYRCTSDGTYDGNEVLSLKFDTADMSGLTQTQRRIVAIHELGHAYGLGHVTSGCRVMRQGTYKFSCGGSFPDSDAVNGVNAIY